MLASAFGFRDQDFLKLRLYARLRAHIYRGLRRQARGDRVGAVRDFAAVRNDPAAPPEAKRAAGKKLDEWTHSGSRRTDTSHPTVAGRWPGVRAFPGARSSHRGLVAAGREQFTNRR